MFQRLLWERWPKVSIRLVIAREGMQRIKQHPPWVVAASQPDTTAYSQGYPREWLEPPLVTYAG